MNIEKDKPYDHTDNLQDDLDIIGYEFLEICSTDDVCGVSVEVKERLCADCVHKGNLPNPDSVPVVVNSLSGHIEGHGFQCGCCGKFLEKLRNQMKND